MMIPSSTDYNEPVPNIIYDLNLTVKDTVFNNLDEIVDLTSQIKKFLNLSQK